MLADLFFSVHGAERNMDAKAAQPRHSQQGKGLPRLIGNSL